MVAFVQAWNAQQLDTPFMSMFSSEVWYSALPPCQLPRTSRYYLAMVAFVQAWNTQQLDTPFVSMFCLKVWYSALPPCHHLLTSRYYLACEVSFVQAWNTQQLDTPFMCMFSSELWYSALPPCHHLLISRPCHAWACIGSRHLAFDALYIVFMIFLKPCIMSISPWTLKTINT